MGRSVTPFFKEIGDDPASSGVVNVDVQEGFVDAKV